MASSTLLSDVLNATKADFKTKMPAEAWNSIMKANAGLAARYTPKPLEIGAKPVDFSLPNAKGEKLSLSTLLKENKAVVLTWYRGGWCPYCNLAMRSLIEANKELKSLGARLVALTPETPDESLSSAEKNEFTFDVLSDDDCKVADSFGIAYEIGDELKGLLNGFGVDMANKNSNDGKRAEKLPVSATFVLDKDGKIVYRFVDLDYTKRAEPADIIAAVKKIV